jgi:hypothetical protein
MIDQAHNFGPGMCLSRRYDRKLAKIYKISAKIAPSTTIEVERGLMRAMVLGDKSETVGMNKLGISEDSEAG